jgi:NADH-quinone oxidoreductase subunit J
MNDPLVAIAFYVVAAVTIVSAIAVVTLRNIVHAALSLVLSFVGVAAVYVLMSADFVAAVQVLIYAGAVTVLLLFAIMLTRAPGSAQSNPDNSQRPVAFVVAGALLVALVMALRSAAWPAQAPVPAPSSVEVVGQQLFTTYALAFEVASVLLLVAMVGAIMLARED